MLVTNTILLETLNADEGDVTQLFWVNNRLEMS